MAVSYVGEADLHHLSWGTTLPGSAHGLLGGGSALSGPRWRCLGSHPVFAVGEVGLVGAPGGFLCCSRIGGGLLVGLSHDCRLFLLRRLGLEEHLLG